MDLVRLVLPFALHAVAVGSGLIEDGLAEHVKRCVGLLVTHLSEPLAILEREDRPLVLQEVAGVDPLGDEEMPAVGGRQLEDVGA